MKELAKSIMVLLWEFIKLIGCLAVIVFGIIGIFKYIL